MLWAPKASMFTKGGMGIFPSTSYEPDLRLSNFAVKMSRPREDRRRIQR